MEVSKSLSCENNTSTLFSAVPDSSNMPDRFAELCLESLNEKGRTLTSITGKTVG